MSEIQDEEKLTDSHIITQIRVYEGPLRLLSNYEFKWHVLPLYTVVMEER